jgi:flagellar M-ring protein FliF
MEFLKKSWAQVQAFLGQLSITARWLIGCLMIIFVLVGWLMLQYAASPELMVITQFAGDRQGEVVAKLERSGIPVRTEGGQIQVPAERYSEAMVILVSSDLMAADTSRAFDEMIAHQSPWQSNAQNEQALLLAKQKVLGHIVGKMMGVRSASVMLATPQKQGFGATFVHPSASVNVVMQGRSRVEKPLVEAIAGLVSGALAEMTPHDVVVIDANRGRQYTVKSADDVAPGETLELVGQLEQRYRDKIGEVLGYIPGVIIAVNVRITPVHTKRIEEYDYESSEPLKTEFTRETERRDVTNAGEPGARPNTGLDIAGSSQGGSFEQINESRNEFNEKNLTRRTHTTETGHTTKQVSVTVNVPRSYFLAVYRQSRPDEKDDPGEEALKPIIEEQLAQIQAQVEPLISVDEDGGMVLAHMIPDRQQLLALTGRGGEASAGAGGVSGMLNSAWAKPAGLAGLALLSLGIMFGMVRKATQQPEIPSLDELAGIPPKLPGDEEITGEAPEADDTMMGLELSEEELEMRRMTEQIAEMISENPYEAANLVNRWILKDE